MRNAYILLGISTVAFSYLLRLGTPSWIIPKVPAKLLAARDSESVLARGEPLSIADVSQADLELIPGVAGREAATLLASREEVILCVDEGTSLAGCLQRLDDIGPATADLLGAYLSTYSDQGAPEAGVGP